MRNIQIKHKLLQAARFAKNTLTRLQPGQKKVLHHIRQQRILAEQGLDSLARNHPENLPVFDGPVLVDGQWDNPNYWLRYSLLRAGLGLSALDEYLLLGTAKQTELSETARQLKFRDIIDGPNQGKIGAGQKREAARLADRLRDGEDLLEMVFAHEIPGMIFYDAILKRQRKASLDVTDPMLELHLLEGLQAIARAEHVLELHTWGLVVVSHPFNYAYGILAWIALTRNIPVILPYGLFGVTRMTRFYKPADLVRFYDRPVDKDITDLSSKNRQQLEDIGAAYLDSRSQGKADDLASQYAFQRGTENDTLTRTTLCRQQGWDPEKPIIGFYASNWYDWPHQLGMTRFRDFLDWTEASFRAAVENTSVNWIFKPHPCETWFGGVSLRDMLERLGNADHIRIADEKWHNGDVMNILDALVTYHGTAGVEFAGMGKPVLVPDHGKYEDCGFVKLAASREDYLNLLGQNWWQDMDPGFVQQRAQIFAGMWFCAPQWHGQFLIPDDTGQDKLYDILPAFIEDNDKAIRQEIQHLRNWYESGDMYSHTFKMKHNDSFILTTR